MNRNIRITKRRFSYTHPTLFTQEVKSLLFGSPCALNTLIMGFSGSKSYCPPDIDLSNAERTPRSLPSMLASKCWIVTQWRLRILHNSNTVRVTEVIISYHQAIPSVDKMSAYLYIWVDVLSPAELKLLNINKQQIAHENLLAYPTKTNKTVNNFLANAFKLKLATCLLTTSKPR